jgi:hypothetical protein
MCCVASGIFESTNRGPDELHGLWKGCLPRALDGDGQQLVPRMQCLPQHDRAILSLNCFDEVVGAFSVCGDCETTCRGVSRALKKNAAFAAALAAQAMVMTVVMTWRQHTLAH